MQLPQEVLSILREMMFIPYENLSKIVGFSQDTNWYKVLDTPDKLYKKIVDLGAGGTCYSLTYFLHSRMREKGFDTEFLTAHKYHFKNIHCGLLFVFEGCEYLLDPGYMIYEPIPIPQAGDTVVCPFIPNQVQLQHIAEPAVLRLYSGRSGDLKFRFDFNKTAVKSEDFFKYWKASFFLEMMQYPVLNKVVDGIQHYIQKSNYMQRSAQGSKMEKLTPPKFTEVVKNQFGLSEDLIDAGREVFLQKGRVFF